MVVAVEEPAFTKTKETAAGLECNTKHLHRIFVNVKEVLHREFVPRGSRENYGFWRKFVARKTGTLPQPQLTLASGQRVSTPPSRQFLTENNMAVVPHPLHSLDLDPRDFTLFPKMKLKLRERPFDTVDEIQTKS